MKRHALSLLAVLALIVGAGPPLARGSEAHGPKKTPAPATDSGKKRKASPRLDAQPGGTESMQTRLARIDEQIAREKSKAQEHVARLNGMRGRGPAEHAAERSARIDMRIRDVNEHLERALARLEERRQRVIAGRPENDEKANATEVPKAPAKPARQ